MRGLHSYESTKLLLEGWSVYYNCVRPHQSLGNRTPAQAAGMDVPNTWMGLIEEATKQEAITTAEPIDGETTERGVDPFLDMMQLEVKTR